MPAVVTCRAAVPEDVEPLYQLIAGYAERGIMLPRSPEALQRQLRHFVVAEIDNELVGCGSLCQLGPELVEIRSLGISDGHKGQGIGSHLLNKLIEHAAARKLRKVMALTYEVSFFKKNGFEVVDTSIFPEKVWADCRHCPKQDRCDEIAVLKVLSL
ncbi:N-acetyltransferase [Paenibacillus sp. Z6-24]